MSGSSPHIIPLELDSSWADGLPRCYICGEEIPWEKLVVLPGAYSGEDDPPDHLIPIHREGCLER